MIDHQYTLIGKQRAFRPSVIAGPVAPTCHHRERKSVAGKG